MRLAKILLIYTVFLLTLVGIQSPVHAGCYINLVGKNGSNQKMWLDPFMSKVKIQNGTWKRIFVGKGDNINDFTIQAGADYTHVYKAGFGCKKKRRYKLVIRRAGCEKAVYIPGHRTWTKMRTVDLGDIARHCP